MFKLHPQLEADCFWLGDFPLSRILLMNDSRYPWLILVPKRYGVTEQFRLSQKDQLQLMMESSAVAEILLALFNGDKMNVAALGNVVSQLHVHHVVRYEKDEAWPAPIWGKGSAVAYGKESREKTIALIVAALKDNVSSVSRKFELELSGVEALSFSVNN